MGKTVLKKDVIIEDSYSLRALADISFMAGCAFATTFASQWLKEKIGLLAAMDLPIDERALLEGFQRDVVEAGNIHVLGDGTTDR